MSLGKQAKIISKTQQEAVLRYLETTRHVKRNKVVFLLSIRAGLRSKEISALTWGMITDAEGQLSDAISLQDVASKGRSGGTVWLNKELKTALETLKLSSDRALPIDRVIRSERDQNVSAQVIVNMLWNWYRKLGFDGCSSHSGRRTFITNAAKKISTVGGSIQDVRALARHRSLQMTQRYIEMDVQAQKRVVQLI